MRRSPTFSRFAEAEVPQAGYAEQVYYHDLRTDSRGCTRIAFVNRGAGLGLVWRYELAALPLLTQWKMMGEGEYVMGIEPCTCPVGGRSAARKEGALRELAPGALSSSR